MSPLDLLRLFPEFGAPSWARWRGILALITPLIRALYIAAGRGSGKSRIIAFLAVVYACREYPRRAAGERIFVGVFAPDRKQAATTFAYILGLLKSVPTLAALIERERAERIDLCNGVSVEVLTASKAAPRSRSYGLAVVEEAAFLETSEESSEPDIELLRALRPALARVPGSLLCVVSSPYAKRGILHAAAERHEAGTAPASELFITGATEELNPTFDREAIEAAYAEDPTGARTEYGAEFRNDIETYLSLEAVRAVTVEGRLELSPVRGTTYCGFIDFAGGSGKDSATLAVAHADKRGDQRIGILDLVREVRPQFSPERVAADFARTLKGYGIKRATADRYAADFAVEALKRHGVELLPAEQPKSDLYRELLPLINSARVELLDVPRLASQLTSLERRRARGGRDSIDHPPRGRDDVANACAGALVIAAKQPKLHKLTWGSGALAGRAQAIRAPSRFVSIPQPLAAHAMQAIASSLLRRR